MNNTRLLDRAAELVPPLRRGEVEPVGGFRLLARYSPERETLDLGQLSRLPLGRGQNLCLDFGAHHVGYLTLELSSTGSHPDAPAYLKLKFAETLKELSENSDDYDGWVSRSWIQEEYLHVDQLPAKVELPRRYAFRYLKITVEDTSPKYRLILRQARVQTVTSADYGALRPADFGDPMLNRIYEVSLRTLANCMQEVFEDGPKRDRRLWMGDFRLQALTNYVGFRNYELVKRCLYLFGGSRFPDGRVSACLFTSPSPAADDTYLFDYAMFYVAALEEYLRETGDEEALNDLYGVAMEQVELALRQCSGDLVTRQMAEDTFVDWAEGLDKTACAQGVLIDALGYARCLARRKQDRARDAWLLERAEKMKAAARARFWDEKKRCFVSNGQISIASQIWMVLADVTRPDEAAELMGRAEEFLDAYPMTTPYMHHYYVMALLRAGLRRQALEHLKSYWGSMIEAGADTFWESWDPANPDASPYGGSVINSYCHAWSCTPAYILSRYLLPDSGAPDLGTITI